jgi:hypothetical protein
MAAARPPGRGTRPAAPAPHAGRRRPRRPARRLVLGMALILLAAPGPSVAADDTDGTDVPSSLEAGVPEADPDPGLVPGGRYENGDAGGGTAPPAAAGHGPDPGHDGGHGGGHGDPPEESALQAQLGAGQGCGSGGCPDEPDLPVDLAAAAAGGGGARGGAGGGDRLRLRWHHNQPRLTPELLDQLTPEQLDEMEVELQALEEQQRAERAEADEQLREREQRGHEALEARWARRAEAERRRAAAEERQAELQQAAPLDPVLSAPGNFRGRLEAIRHHWEALEPPGQRQHLNAAALSRQLGITGGQTRTALDYLRAERAILPEWRRVQEAGGGGQGEQLDPDELALRFMLNPEAAASVLRDLGSRGEEGRSTPQEDQGPPGESRNAMRMVVDGSQGLATLPTDRSTPEVHGIPPTGGNGTEASGPPPYVAVRLDGRQDRPVTDRPQVTGPPPSTAVLPWVVGLGGVGLAYVIYKAVRTGGAFALCNVPCAGLSLALP